MACVTAEIRFEFYKILIKLKSLLWLAAVVLDSTDRPVGTAGRHSSVPASTSLFLPFCSTFYYGTVYHSIDNFPLLEKWRIVSPLPTPVQVVDHSILWPDSRCLSSPAVRWSLPVSLSPCWSPSLVICPLCIEVFLERKQNRYTLLPLPLKTCSLLLTSSSHIVL